MKDLKINQSCHWGQTALTLVHIDINRVLTTSNHHLTLYLMNTKKGKRYKELTFMYKRAASSSQNYLGTQKREIRHQFHRLHTRESARVTLTPALQSQTSSSESEFGYICETQTVQR